MTNVNGPMPAPQQDPVAVRAVRRCVSWVGRRAVEQDRGSATVQIVVLIGGLYLLLFAGVQGAMLFHARSIAIAAAQEGARAGAAQISSAEAGHAAAMSFATTAGDSLRQVAVSATRDATTSTVVVSGTTLSLVPGWQPTVSQTATFPVERITQ